VLGVLVAVLRDPAELGPVAEARERAEAAEEARLVEAEVGTTAARRAQLREVRLAGAPDLVPGSDEPGGLYAETGRLPNREAADLDQLRLATSSRTRGR